MPAQVFLSARAAFGPLLGSRVALPDDIEGMDLAWLQRSGLTKKVLLGARFKEPQEAVAARTMSAMDTGEDDQEEDEGWGIVDIYRRAQTTHYTDPPGTHPL